MDLINDRGGELSFITQMRQNKLNKNDKSLCFIKLKQVLDHRVHKLGITALGPYFFRCLCIGVRTRFR